VFSTIAPPKKGQEPGAVALVRLADSLKNSIEKRVLLGGGGPIQITMGRHEDNDVLLEMKSVSKVHCQVALRPFQLPGHDESHEAAFLRDNSKHGTLVNGEPADRPWHWLQHGDRIGLRNLKGASEAVLDLYKVEYSPLRKLPGDLVALDEVPEDPMPAKAGVPEEAPAKPRSSGRLAAAKPKAPSAFGKEILGRVIDVHYPDEDPPATFRVRIMKFEENTGFFNVDSEGLSLWDGESFDDTINLNDMYSKGHIKFIDEAEAKAPADAAGRGGADEQSPDKKRKTNE